MNAPRPTPSDSLLRSAPDFSLVHGGPLLQFLLIRRYFRLPVWSRFPWQVSRIGLNRVPPHPDHNGGLGVLGATPCAFLPLPTAHGAIVAGNLARRCVREFDARWLRGGAPADEPLVGSGDIQFLADFGNRSEAVRSMRVTPVSKDAIVRFAGAARLPSAPRLLTMMPWETLQKKRPGSFF